MTLIEKVGRWGVGIMAVFLSLMIWVATEEPPKLVVDKPVASIEMPRTRAEELLVEMLHLCASMQRGGDPGWQWCWRQWDLAMTRQERLTGVKVQAGIPY